MVLLSTIYTSAFSGSRVSGSEAPFSWSSSFFTFPRLLLGNTTGMGEAQLLCFLLHTCYLVLFWFIIVLLYSGRATRSLLDTPPNRVQRFTHCTLHQKWHLAGTHAHTHTHTHTTHTLAQRACVLGLWSSGSCSAAVLSDHQSSSRAWTGRRGRRTGKSKPAGGGTGQGTRPPRIHRSSGSVVHGFLASESLFSVQRKKRKLAYKNRSRSLSVCLSVC